MTVAPGTAPSPDVGTARHPPGAAAPSTGSVPDKSLRSNLVICRNAIASPACLSGPMNKARREAALEALQASGGTHFVVLLRDRNNLKFRGIYEVTPTAVRKVFGSGPKALRAEMTDGFYRYNSGNREFQTLT